MIIPLTNSIKTGSEKFIGLDRTLLDYWAWAHSDILSNAERGKIAEYIVGCALKSKSSCRVEWDEVDIISDVGLRLEVKSSAYLQTWAQSKPSSIRFDIAPKLTWNEHTHSYDGSLARHSDVYVFCVFTSTDAANANTMDISQWDFYVLSTDILNLKVPNQKSISLSSLIKLGATKTDYIGLYAAVISAEKQN